MLTYNEILNGISQYRSKYKGAHGMHVVIDYTFLHNPAAGSAVQYDGKVYLNPYSIEDFDDLETILKHEDLGHLLIENIFNTRKRFISLCYDVWCSTEFKKEYEYIHEYYYPSCIEFGDSVIGVRIHADKLKPLIYPSEYMALWVQRHDYVKCNFLSYIRKSKIEKKLNKYLKHYTFKNIIRPKHWVKGGVSVKDFSHLN